MTLTRLLIRKSQHWCLTPLLSFEPKEKGLIVREFPSEVRSLKETFIMQKRYAFRVL